MFISTLLDQASGLLTLNASYVSVLDNLFRSRVALPQLLRSPAGQRPRMLV